MQPHAYDTREKTHFATKLNRHKEFHIKSTEYKTSFQLFDGLRETGSAFIIIPLQCKYNNALASAHYVRVHAVKIVEKGRESQIYIIRNIATSEI